MTYQIEIGPDLINLVKARIAYIQNPEDPEYFEKLDELDRKIARIITYEIAARDKYHNHIFSCKHCLPQVSIYCPIGEQARQEYNQINLRIEHD